MKTILITGATAGFGEAAARRFAGGGWRVIGTGRRGERLRALAEELGDAFLPLEIDMRDSRRVESLAHLDAPWGDIDLLLNNAGLAPPTDPLPETDWQRIEDVIETNVTGLVALTRALLPKIVERKGADHQPVVGRRDLPLQGRRSVRAAQRRSSGNSRSTFAATFAAPASGSPRSSRAWPRPSSRSFAPAATNRHRDKLYAGMDPMTAEDIAET